MKACRLLWILPAVFVLALGLVDKGYGGTTGKLTGRVTDATTGEPLPGVNISIEGTQRGATTDADGYYLVLSMDPGSCRLVASLVGYGSVRKVDVKIAADFTTTVDFQLKETVLEAAELVVTAERPPVEPDKTSSHYVVSSEQIEALPMARSLTDLVALQPGVNVTNAQVIRGGDTQDVSYYVDGVRLNNNDAYGRQFSGINKTAVQEITVISGGANAEYGNLESGAVSVVTKEGGRNYEGWTDLRYTPPQQQHWGSNIYVSPFNKDKVKWTDKSWTSETVILGVGEDGVKGTADDDVGLAHRKIGYQDAKGAYIEGGLSGPIGSQMSFFASTRWTKQPQNVIGVFPTLQTPFDMRENGKLTFRPTQNIKMSVGGIYSKVKGFNAATNVSRDLTSNGQNIFLPDGSGAGESKITDQVLYATLTHTLGSKTFYEVKLGWYSTVQDTANIPNARDKFGFLVPTVAQKDLDGWFNVAPATAVNYTIADRTRLSLKADLSSQITRGHFVKTGFAITRYNLYYFNYQSPTAASRRIEFITKSGNLPDEKAPLNPIQYEFYVQDKMEFEGMVLNVGLRYDAFYTNHRFYNVSQLQSPQYRWLIFHKDTPTVDPTWATKLSPRIGVSHPITSRSAFHFTAGLYTNLPDYWSFFRELWVANAGDKYVPWDAFNGLRAQDRMANPYVAYQKTRAYEAGADWNFVSDYTAGVSAYYKSAIDKVSSGSRYWMEPQGNTYVWGLKPNGYQDLKGFELSVRKAFSHMFSFNAAINFGWASQGFVGSNATQFFPDSSFVADRTLYHDWQWDVAQNKYVPKYLSEADIKKYGNIANNQIRGRELSVDQQAVVVWERMDAKKAYDAPDGMYASWQPTYGSTAPLLAPKGVDNRVQSSLSVFFQSPAKFGPGLRKFYPFGDLRVNMIWRIQSGSFVAYTPPGKQQEYRHRPIREWTDLQVEKTLINSGSRNAIVYLEVLNLFNQQDSSIPFNYPDYVRWGLNAPRPDDTAYQQYGDYNELTRYVGNPRDVGLGIRVNF